MTKINFKQPKYIFPVVIFVPVCALIYFVMQTFGGSGDDEQKVATDRINTELPQANAEEAGDKMYEMSRRFGDEDAFTAVGALGEEKTDSEELEHGYSEEELNRLDAAEAERLRQQQELEELELQELPLSYRSKLPTSAKDMVCNVNTIKIIISIVFILLFFIRSPPNDTLYFFFCVIFFLILLSYNSF